jgi:ABC-type multidrug transport system fused ATPase/permease subunit
MLYKYPLDIYSQKIVYDVRKKIFSKLLRVPVSFFDKK